MIETLSYSGLSKLLYSPKLFYKHYILGEKEDSVDSWAVEGNLFDCLLTDKANFDNRFAVVPGVIPTENTKKLVYKIFKERTDDSASTDLYVYRDDILDALKMMNLHQSLKTDEQRLEKVLTDDAKNYFKFLCESERKIVIDNETLERNQNRVDLILSNQRAVDRMYLADVPEGIEVLQQPNLQADTKDKYGFNLRGIADRIIVDHNSKTVTIFDIKTTGKTVNDFYPDTYKFYNYDLQAAMYVYLAGADPRFKEYEIKFEFFVIDKYDQFVFFPLSDKVMLTNKWELDHQLNVAKYHISNFDYSLPYKFKDGIFVIEFIE